ncbi:hypothetical protein FHS85_002886 [Rhodoligotrophos appendicifer]|uniref:hypothetical protein n=1 Tax=Rhodoligotrophos appendicifer TaxID=987056 RepID=UPI001478A186|nr:hypothetical protein [Rhodoligotrophos appendicifer]
MRHWSPAECFIVALCITIGLLLAVIGDFAEQARLIRTWSSHAKTIDGRLPAMCVMPPKERA